MKKVAVNPYMPGWEYVPDGEPHVFGDRVYVYGSHDKAGGEAYCEENYVCWSAPLDDLSDWKCHGESYRREQDPINTDGHLPLCAPDVAQGPDGRYYMYYAMDFEYICVAVSDVPQGPFEFYGTVHYPDGKNVTEGVRFDPGILSEEGGNYLYYGFCPPFHHPTMGPDVNEGSYMVELEDDMLTVRNAPVCVAYGYEAMKGTDYEEHPFYEAPSIRHYGDLYYFIYSSLQGHELCYATAETPQGPFRYQGVLISNGDLGYKGRTEPLNFYANNHGSMVKIDERYYIFYHRHTHGTHFSRQACAEQVYMNEDGTFDQAEMTSCGLNGDSVPAAGIYSAYIICNLLGPDGAYKIPSNPAERPENAPYLFQEEDKAADHGLNQYVRNLRGGTACAVKYLDFDTCIQHEAMLRIRGESAKVTMHLDDPDTEPFYTVITEKTDTWRTYRGNFDKIKGIHAVWFCFDLEKETDKIDFSDFGFQ